MSASALRDDGVVVQLTHPETWTPGGGRHTEAEAVAGYDRGHAGEAVERGFRVHLRPGGVPLGFRLVVFVTLGGLSLGPSHNTQGRLSANRSAPAPAGRPSWAGGGGDTRFYMLGAWTRASRGAPGHRFRGGRSQAIRSSSPGLH